MCYVLVATDTEGRQLARYFVFPASAGLTVKTSSGVAAFVPPGATLDDALLGTAGAWVPLPCAWTLRPLDAVAQTNLQNAIAATKASVSPSGSIVPGLPGGWPTSVPLWAP
jgi:hypothetical protein